MGGNIRRAQRENFWTGRVIVSFCYVVCVKPFHKCCKINRTKLLWSMLSLNVVKLLPSEIIWSNSSLKIDLKLDLISLGGQLVIEMKGMEVQIRSQKKMGG